MSLIKAVTHSPKALIGGVRVGARSGAVLDAVNPATGEVITQIPRMNHEDADLAVRAASAAFPAWSALDPAVRAAYLYRLAAALLDHADELAHIDSLDNGSPLREMRFDVDVTVMSIRYFAGLVLQNQGATVPTAAGRLIYSLKQPFGAVGRIGAFNHPLLFTLGKLAPALAAGNTIVTKPSEHTSLSALAAADLVNEIFPPGVINIVTGLGSEVGDAIVAHEDVRRLAFIGSADTGRAIQRRAAEVAVKTVTLELGGKNPIVVFPDADLDKAIDGVVTGMNFTWQGQSCGSTSRLLVHEAIHREFVDRLAQRIEAIRPGLPDDPMAGCGAIVTTGQLEKVLRYVQLGRDEGAELVVGGTRATDGPLAQGNFVHPALFDNVAPDSRLAQEEIFGPVLATIPFKDYEQAIRIANGVRFGLTASVFTSDLSVAHRFAHEVEAGYVWINESSRHFLGANFGGFKDSGVGREESLDELASWSQDKSVSVLYG